MTEDAIITPTNNGPYHVRGRFRVVLPSGRELETEGETWLCRCGGSKNKPFCDGTHSKIGFAAAEAAVAQADAAAEFQAVAGASALGEGDLIGVEVAGQPVVVGKVDGTCYAIGGICTHQGARLEEGFLDGAVVTCPLHDSGFDIRTGEAVRLPADTPVPTYAVRVEGDSILVSTRPSNEKVS